MFKDAACCPDNKNPSCQRFNQSYFKFMVHCSIASARNY